MTIAYKETQISFLDQGKGPCVVLLHGFLESKLFFDRLVQDLNKSFRCISIDLLGHGESGNIGYIHTMEDMADQINTILEQLKIRKVIFVGHSMGGYAALAFAELYPEKVRGLCLLNSTSRADSPAKKTSRERAIIQIKKNHESFIRIAIPLLFRPKNRIQFKSEIRELKQVALSNSKQGIIAALEGMKIRTDREILLHFGPYPKLLILGKKDDILPFEKQLDQVNNNKTDLDVMPDGHMSLIENYQDCLYSIEKFLKHCTFAKEQDYLN